MVAESEQWIRIGRLGKPHGIKGDIRCYSLSDVDDRFTGLSTVWWQDSKSRLERLQVERIRPAERFFLVKFKAYDTPEKVKALANGFLVIPKAWRGNLPAGRYFIDDIIGIKVCDDRGQALGEVTEVWQPGPHDVYEIHGARGVLMVPVIDDYIIDVNIDERVMTIKVPEVDD